MSSSVLSSQPFITVAVAFDHHAKPLAKLGADLARSLGKELCLLHVIESWDSIMKEQVFAVYTPLWDVIPKIDASTRETAQRQLDEIRASLPADLSVKTVIVTGSPVETIAREASDLGTALLLVGVTYKAATLLPSGLSTGLSLLAYSPVPVLVADTDRHLPRIDACVKLLVSDDLTAQSEAAVAFAANLCDGIRQSQIHHVHINALSPRDLRTALEGAAAAAYATLPEAEIEAVTNALSRERLKSLDTRFNKYRRSGSTSDVKYSASVAPGSVKRELPELIKDNAPDILIFGRHKAFHTKPFSLGRMPFRAMLSLHLPVLVVPAC